MANLLGRLLIVAALVALIGVPILAARTTADTGAGCDQAISQAIGIDPSSDTVENPTGGSGSCAAVRQWLTGVESSPPEDAPPSAAPR